MNMQNRYRAEQASRISSTYGTGDTRAQLKLRDQAGQTHWLRVSATELETIKAILRGVTFEACLGCGRSESDCIADPCPDVIADRQA